MKEVLICGLRVRPIGIQNYWISEAGDVFNKVGNDFRLMKPFMTKDKHMKIELKVKKGVGKKFFIHRLVYQSFVGDLRDGYVIEHKNSIPYQNYYKNLKQNTQSENIKTAVKAKHWNQNKKVIKVFNIKTSEYETYDSIKELYKKLNISYNSGSLKKLIKNHRFINTYIFIGTWRSNDYRKDKNQRSDFE